MNSQLNLEEISILIYGVKIFCISIFTWYLALKIIDLKTSKSNKVIVIVISAIVAVVCGVIKSQTDSFYSIICLAIILSIIFSGVQKKDITYSIMIIAISLSINYILLFLSTFVAFLPNYIITTQNDYVEFIILMIFYMIFVYGFTKIRRVENGLIFLKNKLENEYSNLIILNISVVILFLVIIISNYSQEIADKIGIGLVICSVIMFVTIQKSLQLYYKQKLMVQELEETKAELEEKKQEIKELERENLNFSKVSHSIAHKQKSLEYKLNELMLKTEMGSELDLKDRLKNATKELQQDIVIEIDKTEIPEIDDMLAYMQSECVKEKIDFQLQLSGNIHYMVNHCVDKEKLEILLADHIRNAIIAIQCSNNSNKSILVKLGMIEGVYSLYIYDSGIEFEVETFPNLGKKPSTTHADRGGTGMGFMNTFDTLKQYQASMIIHEYGKPCPENFTKVIQIKFDKKKEFKICSYREKEINLP